MEALRARTPNRYRWLMWFLPVVLLLFLLLLFLPRFRTRAASFSTVTTDTTFRVVRKDFAPSLRLNGTTQAAR